MGLIERISGKIKSIYGLLIFFSIIGTITYQYSKNIPITTLSVLMTIVIFFVWDIHERVGNLENIYERELEILNNRKR